MTKTDLLREGREKIENIEQQFIALEEEEKTLRVQLAGASATERPSIAEKIKANEQKYIELAEHGERIASKIKQFRDKVSSPN